MPIDIFFIVYYKLIMKKSRVNVSDMVIREHLGFCNLKVRCLPKIYLNVGPIIAPSVFFSAIPPMRRSMFSALL